MPRSKPAPETVLAKLLTWIEQALEFNETGEEQHRPDDMLLVEAVTAWWIGFVGRPTLIGERGSRLIRLTMNKPRGEGLTTRDFDPAVLAAILAHCVGGGGVSLEPHGPCGDFYYLRLRVHGHRADGQRRRVYLLRIAADTQSGHMTREPVDFRSLLRADLTTRPQGAAEGARYGTAEAVQDTVDRVRELTETKPVALPDGLTVARAERMLADAYRLRSAVPLAEAG